MDFCVYLAFYWLYKFVVYKLSNCIFQMEKFTFFLEQKPISSHQVMDPDDFSKIEKYKTISVVKKNSGCDDKRVRTQNRI